MDVKSFLGLARYYQRFIKDFSKLASSLFGFLAKDSEFLWSKSCQEDLDSLKDKLTTTPVSSATYFDIWGSNTGLAMLFVLKERLHQSSFPFSFTPLYSHNPATSILPLKACINPFSLRSLGTEFKSSYNRNHMTVCLHKFFPCHIWRKPMRLNPRRPIISTAIGRRPLFPCSQIDCTINHDQKWFSFVPTTKCHSSNGISHLYMITTQAPTVVR